MCTITYNSQDMEAAQVCIDRWMDKEYIYIHIHIYIYIYTMEHYSAIKKNEILAFAITWLEIKSVMLSGISQSEKDKYHMILLMYVILRNESKWAKEEKRQTHQETDC